MNPTAPPVIPPQPSTQQPIVITPDTVTPKKKFKISKTVLGIMAVVVIAIAIPVTLYVISQRQTITQQAAPATAQPPATAVAQVYNAYILQPELDAFITSSGKEKIDALQLLIERKVLDEESKRTSITVSDTEITEKMKTIGIENFESMRIFTKYDLLKEKILMANVQYIEALVIDFYLPPPDYVVPDRTPEAERKIADLRAKEDEVLSEITKQMQSSDDTLGIAKDVIVKYPVYDGILGVNGKVWKTGLDEALFTDPYIFVLSKDRVKTDFTSALESGVQGVAKSFTYTDKSGGGVIKVIKKNSSSFSSYEDWLADKKSKNVKVF